MNLLVLFFLLYLKVCSIYCQSKCETFDTCSKCISYTKEICVWCSAKDHIGHRCHSQNPLDPYWCSQPVYDPIEVQWTSNKTLNDGADNKEIVQFTPQNIKIKARANVPIKFKMTYKPALRYPLDVYYIIDSTKTMNSYKEDLRKQALEIHDQLSLKTNNVKLGVGSFIEKPSLPYVDTSNQKAYSFKNHQSLTSNMSLFKNAFADLLKNDGTNNDAPEATLDALMEAMVCKSVIEWRNNSHRIILLSTDATYHRAGDGKFIGAIKPHDMQCHIVDNEYSKTSLMFDYPSVSQINKIATEKNIMIIFAIKSEFKKDYEALAKKIKNAKYIPLLEKSDLVKMITNEYDEIASSVQIDAKTQPSISLTFEPNCIVKNTCSSKRKEPFEITGTLMIESCPASPTFYEVKIGPVSIDEKLTILVEANCQCDCEKPDQAEKNSDLCSKHGTYQCGICECNHNRYGDNCSCIGSVKDLEKCKANSNDPKPCSDRGICRCGTCTSCQKGFTGKFCEIDNNSCKRPDGILCAGHGKCNNGVCQCDHGWLPDDCRCPTGTDSCVGADSDEPCSGRGDCVCGRCVCKYTPNTNQYCTGKYCDNCMESKPERCPELEDYAYCNLNQNKTDCDERYNITDSEVFLVNKSLMYSDRWHKAKMWCRKELDDEKILIFRYYSPKAASNSSLLLIIQAELDFMPVADIWVVVCSVVGAVLLIGILTLVAWKILVDMHDKREYEKFKRSSTAAGYGVSLNPLYQSPATSFSNPAYNCS